MPQKVLTVTFLTAVLVAGEQWIEAANALPSVVSGSAASAVLWHEPIDIQTRNLYYGAGGEKHQPRPPFTFIEEDTDGSQPKYVVKDSEDVKWTVKLGAEARPETAATRFVWAVGYYVNEDYFLPELKVDGMPAHLKRGRNLVGPDGLMHNARLKRHIKDEKSAGNWDWQKSPFAGTRELNGLRTMMALINDWDLKKVNNKIYAGKDDAPPIYIVSDLGATFGPPGVSFPLSRSRGDLEKYAHSKFIKRTTAEYVDFETPRAPFFITGFWPLTYLPRVKLDSLLRHVPRDDVHWMGTILARLSSDQIHNAFRAAGYQPNEIEAFSSVVEDRIRQLNAL